MLGLAISLVGITVPSIWYDEAATIESSIRTWPELWRMVGNVDAVHALYYRLMHLVFEVVGYSPLSLRAPSAVATGVAAAGVVLLARQLGRPRLGVIAGIVFCLLPRVTWMGTEGRSYALSATAAVVMTLVLVRAWRGTSRWWWVLYGVAALVSCTLFLYLALVVLGHGVTAAWLFLSRAPERRGAVPWLLAAGGAGVACLPVALEVVSQGGQLYWIPPLGPDTIREVVRSQWFYSSEAFSLVGWILLLAGVVTLARSGRDRTLLTLLVPALVVPTLLLLLLSLAMPIYQPRYLTMCVPFVALAIGAGLDGIRIRRLRTLTPIVAIALMAVLAVPQAVSQRIPEAKEGSSWAQVADLIAGQRALDPAGETTAIIYGPVYGHPKATTRVIAYSYPAAFENTIDPTIRTPAAETAELWETRAPLAESLDRLGDARIAYLVASTSRDIRAETTTALESVGWRLTGAWSTTFVNVQRYEK